jgi:HK97 family phage major capsid protein
MPDDIKTVVDDIQTTTAALRAELDARKATEEANSESIVKIKKDFDQLLMQYQELVLAKKASDATIQTLEEAIEEGKKRGDDLEVALAMKAQIQDGNERLKISTREYIEKFYECVRSNDKNFSMPPEIAAEESRRYLRYKMPYKSDADIDYIQKEISAAYGPAMGWMMPAEQQMLMEQRRYEMTPMRGLASVITTGSDSEDFPTDDTFITPNRRGELGPAIPETEIDEIFMIEIKLHEMSVNPFVTQKMLRNRTFDLEGWITRRKVVQGFALQESYDYTVGDGVQRARGLFTYPAWDDPEVYQRGALGTIVTTGTTLDDDDLRHLYMSLIEAWQPNARWLMHRKTFSHIMGLKDEEGRWLINPQLLFLGTELQLFGKPVIFGGDVPAPSLTGTFTAGDKVVAYGDFSQYVILDGIAGMNYTIRDEITRKGFVNWYITQNTGGGLIGYQGIKMLQIGA